VLALLGLVQIAANPAVLAALNPLYAGQLLVSDPVKGFVVLGAVFLAVTGAEALYADMGHFGRDALRRAWLYLVFPALLLNYFGQGALVLARPDVLANPFYHLAPDWALYPLVALASAATIIASQAVISGAFSLTRQAMQLGYLPRFEVRHTSHAEIGQVFVPRINAALLVGVLFLILVFRTSDNLGAAYGIAVSGMMAITTALAFLYMRTIPGWTLAVALPVFGLFLVVDFAFLAANLLKVLDGGWFPLTIAAMGAALMATWVKGRALIAARREASALPLTTFLNGVRPDHPKRVPGTAVFLTARVDLVPNALLHSLKHFKVLHERVILLTMRTEDVPRIADDQRVDIQDLDKGFHAVSVHYGFMEEPGVIRALALCRQRGLRFDLLETSFFIGHERLRLAKQSSVARWRRRVFLLLYNNMLGATEFFGIPPNRAIEVGGHTEI
jgi:KUP system potassium uptake protein